MIPIPGERLWVLGLIVALGMLGGSLLGNLGAPWTDKIDANGACWSQSAHNTLRAGLLTTAGVPSAFYFGPLPIPSDRYYTHHPPLLSLLLTGMFAVFGERESVARILPITCSLVSVVLLWLLVKSCTNGRTASFSALCFAAMPMELRYGRMVNFEPVNLVWMLSGLLCLRLWEQTHQRRWHLLILGSLFLSLWTAWLGYLFVLVLCVTLLLSSARPHRHLALVLLGLSAASFALFLLQAQSVQPDAFHGLVAAMNRRMARGVFQVPWLHWARRMAGSLFSHIQPVLWVLGAVGGIVIWRSRNREALRWLGWRAFGFLVMSVVYVVGFRNQSSIHDYASFYFTVPVAIGAAVALDSFSRWCERGSCAIRTGCVAGTCVFLALLMWSGESRALRLRSQFHILAHTAAEPPGLIPDLGKRIRASFSEDTAVVCNFLPDYGPQLHYYAQRELLNGVFTSNEWKEIMAVPENAPVGGVIWMDEPRAIGVLSSLPRGVTKEITIQGSRFTIWRSE